MRALLFTLAALLFFAPCQAQKTPRAQGTPNDAYWFKGEVWVDSNVKLVSYRYLSDTVLLGCDTGGRLFRITKSQIKRWAGEAPGTVAWTAITGKPATYQADSSVFTTNYRNDSAKAAIRAIQQQQGAQIIMNAAGLNQKLNTADSIGKYVTPTQLANQTYPRTSINGQVAKDNGQDSLLGVVAARPVYDSAQHYVPSVGVFTVASTRNVATTADMLQTTGYSISGIGAARYIYDPAVTSAYVTANPRTSFRSANGRGYRLLVTSPLPVEQCGALPGVVSDQQPAIQAALSISKNVIVGPGVFWTARRTLVRDTGATLQGSGRGATTLRAMPGFELNGYRNAVVVIDSASKNAHVTGLHADANRIGKGLGDDARINGIMAMNAATGFLVDWNLADNVTGYAYYATGEETYLAPPSGTFAHNISANSEIHFEAQAADGVLYEDCLATDGDGDIGANSWFHPVSGSKNITYSNCRGQGVTPTGVEMTSNIRPLENITFSNCYFNVTAAGVPCFVTTQDELEIRNLQINNCHFKANGGTAAVFNKAYAVVSNTIFEGGAEAVRVAQNSAVDITGSLITAKTDSSTPTATIALNVAGGVAYTRGGLLRSVSAPGYAIPANGNVLSDPGTRYIPRSETPYAKLSGLTVSAASDTTASLTIGPLAGAPGVMAMYGTGQAVGSLNFAFAVTPGGAQNIFNTGSGGMYYFRVNQAQTMLISSDKRVYVGDSYSPGATRFFVDGTVGSALLTEATDDTDAASKNVAVGQYYSTNGYMRQRRN